MHFKLPRSLSLFSHYAEVEGITSLRMVKNRGHLVHPYTILPLYIHIHISKLVYVCVVHSPLSTLLRFIPHLIKSADLASGLCGRMVLVVSRPSSSDSLSLFDNLQYVEMKEVASLSSSSLKAWN